MASDPDLDASATRLLNALTGACVRAQRRQDSLCVATSGGLDSSVLAAILPRVSDVPIRLFTVAALGAPDAQRARALARHLGLPLTEIAMTRSRVLDALPRLVPLVGASRVDPERAKEWGIDPSTQYVSPLQVSWELPVFAASELSRRFAERLIVGQGADEWLLGYAKHEGLDEAALRLQAEADRRALVEQVLPIEKRIGDALGVQLQYPYLNERVVALCRSLPLDHLMKDGVRKRVLREVARRLDLPDAVVDVPKTAAQYGSGVGALLKELADEAGMHQNEFLTRFLDQRTIAEAHSLRT